MDVARSGAHRTPSVDRGEADRCAPASTPQTNGTLPDPTGAHGGGPPDVPPPRGSTGRDRRWPLVLAAVVVAVLAAVLGVWALAGDGESDHGATVTEPEAGTDATEGPVTTGAPATT